MVVVVIVICTLLMLVLSLVHTVTLKVESVGEVAHKILHYGTCPNLCLLQAHNVCYSVQCLEIDNGFLIKGNGNRKIKIV